MRSEQDLREAHGIIRAAYDQSDDPIEREILAQICHTLAWAIGIDGVFATVVESGRKVIDDAALSIETLDGIDTNDFLA